MLFDSHSGADAADSATVCPEPLWFLAYTRPRLETVALQNQHQQGFDAYLPLYKRLKKTDAGLATAFELMFPRYVFFDHRTLPSRLGRLAPRVAWGTSSALVMSLP
jgi:hypothetical protein